MKGWYVSAAIVLAAWNAAADGGSVASLVETVRAALHARQSDAEVARAIDAMKLADRLDDAAIEALQSDGAGPLTIESLERQRDVSYRLAAPQPLAKLFDAPPAPSATEQTEAIEKARTFATHYTANLPNFLCTEDVRRYTNAKQAWKAEDSVQWEAGYADQREHLKLVGINGQPTTRRSARGPSSSGEFGGVLELVFRPESLAKFAWERWANLNGRPAYVFSFYIDREHADFVLNASGTVIRHRQMVAMRGMVYVDRETFQVRRIVYDAEGVPKGFVISAMHTVVEYDSAEIGGEKFLLPHRSTMRLVMKNGMLHRNVTEFGKYRKFTGEAKIDFEKH